MRELVYKQGNIVDAEEIIIAHGCNSMGVMGSGVARVIKAKYPEAYACYRRRYEEEGLNIGDVILAPCENGKIIANCITQKYYGREKGHIYLDYAALRHCIVILNDFAKSVKKVQLLESLIVAMPMIGSGLAGGNWNKISKILLDESSEFEIVVYTI